MVARLALNERGATAMEYGLIAALIAVAIIVTLMSLSNTVETNLYTTIEALIVS